MLLLTLIMLICRILSAKTIKQGSPNACNVDSSSIKADETNMCGATKFDVIEVSHASHCGETVPQVDTENPPTIRWINAKPVVFFQFSKCLNFVLKKNIQTAHHIRICHH